MYTCCILLVDNCGYKLYTTTLSKENHVATMYVKTEEKQLCISLRVTQ